MASFRHHGVRPSGKGPRERYFVDAFVLEEVRTVSDRVDVGPRAHVIRADLGLIDEVGGVGHFAQIERLVKVVVE
jgi:hypothetical protein